MVDTERIIAAAVRNRAARESQLDRLAPTALQAEAKRAELAGLKERGSRIIREVKQTRELLHIPGFFPTPRPVIDVMLRHARIHEGMTVLEPNAGRGDLLDALRPLGVHIVAYELVAGLVEIVRGKGHDCRCADFLSVSPGDVPPVDVVFMNPPFERGADRAHIRHAHAFLRPGGRLVAVASRTGCSALAEWADDLDGYIVPLPEGSFITSSRPTGVSTGLVVAQR